MFTKSVHVLLSVNRPQLLLQGNYSNCFAFVTTAGTAWNVCDMWLWKNIFV